MTSSYCDPSHKTVRTATSFVNIISGEERSVIFQRITSMKLIIVFHCIVGSTAPCIPISCDCYGDTSSIVQFEFASLFFCVRVKCRWGSTGLLYSIYKTVRAVSHSLWTGGEELPGQKHTQKTRESYTCCSGDFQGSWLFSDNSWWSP